MLALLKDSHYSKKVPVTVTLIYTPIYQENLLTFGSTFELHTFVLSEAFSLLL